MATHNNSADAANTDAPDIDAITSFGTEFAGAPDSMERLWTPHRMAYIESNRPHEPMEPQACPFCLDPNVDDRDRLIVHRGTLVFVVLNLYPYNPGHLMVCPYRHISGYVDLTADETDEFSDATQDAIRALKAASTPEGFNLGMNQGAIAGAGVAAHLHQHIVPRWRGDANFMPIIGHTKPMPALLSDTWEAVTAAWPQHNSA